MARFEEYANKYKHIQMERRDGILQMRLHTDGGTLHWGEAPHAELGQCYSDIGSDPENRVVIVTGTGEYFNARYARGPQWEINPQTWDHIYWDGKKLLMNLLDIEVPMIAAVNGPATIHAELAVLCDIVIASDTAVFQDAPHFPNGIVPGDGVHIVWPPLLGPNRGRYFLLTGQKLSAQEALTLGVVNEVVPREKVLDRAWELARQIVKQPPLTIRYAQQPGQSFSTVIKKHFGPRKTAAALLRALPSLTLKEETLDQIEAQVKERRRHPARIPRL